MINFMLNLVVKSFKFFTSTLIHGGENLAWTIRVLLESLQHVLKMYTWASSENRISIQFRCRLIGLLLKRSFFRKHDFALLVHKICHDYQNLRFWHLKIIPKPKTIIMHSSEIKNQKNQPDINFLVVGNLFYFHLMIFSHMLCLTSMSSIISFFQCVKKSQKQNLPFDDNCVLCNVPLNTLAPKLILKAANELANLHSIYMPPKILLQNHKCETSEDSLAAFKPYKVAPNTEYQQTWYQKNKERYAKHDMECNSNI